MAKYLVTNSSYFEPFTYDQITAPLREMAEMHRASQDAYDQYTMESEALRHYLDSEPEDSEARAMYDSYMSKLERLQNNLWSNGYNSQTRRDLSAARAGYASDITRLGNAIQTRQKRSEAFNEYKKQHPDAIMSEDPGLSSLDEYLKNDRYGLDYYAYSGDKLSNEIATELLAKGRELANDPELMNMNLPGYYFLKTNKGFTNEQLSKAMSAVRAEWNGDRGAALSSLDPIEKIAADTIKSNISRTGASYSVTRNEFDKLLDYAEHGASMATVEPTIEHLNDQQFAYDMQDRNNARSAQRSLYAQKEMYKLQHPEEFDENGNRRLKADPNAPAYVVPSFYVYQQGDDADKLVTKFNKKFNKISPENPVSITFEDGTTKEYTDSNELAEAVKETKGAEYLRNVMGISVTDKPARRKKDMVVHSVQDPSGRVINFVLSYPTKEEREKYPLYKKDTIVLREIDKNGKPGKIEQDLTSFYMEKMTAHNSELRKTLERNGIEDIDEYTLSAKDENRIRKDKNIPSTVPSKYLRTIEKMDISLDELKVPPIVGPSNEAVLRDYALNIVNSYYANSGNPKSRKYPIYKVNKDGRTYDKKNPLNLKNVLNIKDNTHDIDGSGGITSISATPEDILNGMLRIVVAGKGTYVIDSHLVDDVTSDGVERMRMLLPEIYKPFSDPVGTFSQGDDASSETLYRNLYNMNPAYVSDIEDVEDIYTRTLKDVINSDESRDEYYGLIVRLIADAFKKDYEVHAYLNAQHRGDTKANPESALTE